MKPALTLGIILAAALTGGCTKYLQIVPVQALTDQPGAPLKGVPYSLYFDQFAIVTTAKLTGCAPFTLEIGASLAGQTARPDPAFSYMIDPNSMAGLLHSSKFDITYNPDGSVASVNAEVEDHTPAVVLGLAKAAAGIVTLGASGAIPTKGIENVWMAHVIAPEVAPPPPTCLPAAQTALDNYEKQNDLVDAAKATLDAAQAEFDLWTAQMDDSGSSPPKAIRRKFQDAYIRLRGAVQGLESAQAKLAVLESKLIVSDQQLWPGSGVIDKSDDIVGAALTKKAYKVFVNPAAQLSESDKQKLAFKFAFGIAPVGTSPYSTYPKPSNIPGNVGRTGLPYRLPANGELVVRQIAGGTSEDLLNQPVLARQLGRVMILPCTGRPLVKTGCSLNFDTAGVLTKAGTSVDGAAAEKVVDVLSGAVDAAETPTKAIRDRAERRRNAPAAARAELLAQYELDQKLDAARQAKLDAPNAAAAKLAQAEIDAIDRERALLEARQKLKEQQDKLTVPTP